MNQSVHNKLVSFIWSIADDCLRAISCVSADIVALEKESYVLNAEILKL